MKIGYLGPPGSYSHDATCRYIHALAEDAQDVAMPSFAAIIEGVEQGTLENGMIPVENSTHGAVPAVMDMLLKLKKSNVCGELVLTVEHCLLSVNPDINTIRHVFSHEQALEQCREFFSRYYPHIECTPCASTSQACELACEKGAGYAAVAGKLAAGLYDLKIAAQNIHDNCFNQTRFLLLGTQPPSPTGRDKTSIVFAFHDDYPGSLFSVLKSFADRSINLTRIESRPAKHIMGKYIFYIDFAGHAADPSIALLLTEIGKQVNWLKVLGSYPAASDTSEETAGGQLCSAI